MFVMYTYGRNFMWIYYVFIFVILGQPSIDEEEKEKKKV